MFALMVLLGKKPNWETVKGKVIEANFLNQIREIKKD